MFLWTKRAQVEQEKRLAGIETRKFKENSRQEAAIRAKLELEERQALTRRSFIGRMLQLQQEYEQELRRKAARRPKRRKPTRKASTFCCESEPILSKSEAKDEDTTTELVHIPETRTETPIYQPKQQALSPPPQPIPPIKPVPPTKPVPKLKPAPIRVPTPRASPAFKRSPSPIPEEPKRSLSPKFLYRKKEKVSKILHTKSVSESVPLPFSPPRPIIRLKGHFPPPTMQRVARGGEVFSVHVLGESPQYVSSIDESMRHHSVDVESRGAFRRPLRSETSLAHSTKGSESYRSPGIRDYGGKKLEASYRRENVGEEKPAFHVFRDLSFDP